MSTRLAVLAGTTHRLCGPSGRNFKWFDWKTPAVLNFYWQYTRSAEGKSPESYLAAIEEFKALLRPEF